jgi:hypothetical protein
LERAVKRVPGGECAAWRSASRYVASGALATVEMLLERGHGGGDWFRYWTRRLAESRGA